MNIPIEKNDTAVVKPLFICT